MCLGVEVCLGSRVCGRSHTTHSIGQGGMQTHTKTLRTTQYMTGDYVTRMRGSKHELACEQAGETYSAASPRKCVCLLPILIRTCDSLAFAISTSARTSSCVPIMTVALASSFDAADTFAELPTSVCKHSVGLHKQQISSSHVDTVYKCMLCN